MISFLKFFETKNWLIIFLGNHLKVNKFFPIISFRQVNCIFHNLSVNSKHMQLWLGMSLWWIFVLNTEMKFVFPSFSKELLHAVLWLKFPKGWRARSLERSLSYPKHRGLHFYTILFFKVHGFEWCPFQCDCYDVLIKLVNSFSK